ncbi:putative tail protein [Erwinia phage pEa_SNUABM_5]|uniref:Putative tail protein n=1 Tax=Erwinia phage pEa_SNUABM_5 TaxID=2797313 RepID=A0A7T8EQ04_9CAUD|nr:putative tail protein [Erwinia phage pEa_SNUABM_5]QQO90237.1 putative tail protein [Erwinia phage pEa_SNUABM_5]
MRTGNQQLLIGAQIKNFRPEVLTADPDVASLVAGQTAVIWFNSTEGKYKYFNGTTIEKLGGDAELPQGIVLADGTVAMTDDLELSSDDQSGSDDKAAVSKKHVATVVATAVGGKQDKFTGLTENDVVIAGPNNTLVTSNITGAELGYLDGVTSLIQTQLDSKLSKDNAQLSSALDANGNKISNLAAPTNNNDAARKIDIDNALSGMNWQEDINGIQTDATLQPTKAEGSRYVITNAAALHADFGTIADVQNNAIVEADADGEYHVVFDPTAARADGAIAWNHATTQYVRFDGTAWAVFGGMSSIAPGDGLELDGNALNVQVDRALTIVGNNVGINVAAAGGVFVNGTNELAVKRDGNSLASGADGLKVADGGVGYAQLAAAAFGTGLKQDTTAKTIVIDEAALKTLGFIDEEGGSVKALTLTGTAALTDASVVSKKYVDDAITAGGAAGAAKLYVYNKTAAEDTAAAVHTFTHNAGTKLGVVTVTDETGYQIIPDEVIFVDANTLRVEITEAKKLAIAFVTLPVVAA